MVDVFFERKGHILQLSQNPEATKSSDPQNRPGMLAAGFSLCYMCLPAVPQGASNLCSSVAIWDAPAGFASLRLHWSLRSSNLLCGYGSGNRLVCQGR